MTSTERLQPKEGEIERLETKKLSIFNLPLCSLTFTVLMDCAHTLALRIQSQGFEGQRLNED